MSGDSYMSYSNVESKNAIVAVINLYLVKFRSTLQFKAEGFKEYRMATLR